MTKYIFITGGVVSSLGKGITAASIGQILKSRGFKVSMQKFDPYLNVDPGTLSPYQHGEVFVTEDGAETDLDLGHYERFIDEALNKYASVSSGKIYQEVMEKERAGEYEGKTVQVIPHITNAIKDKLVKVAEHSKADVVITEIGGTVGDIESLPFLEAIRQVRKEFGYKNTLYIHNTLVPYLKAAKEIKTKPTQHSVKELMSLGIHPDMIVLRSEVPIEEHVKEKISLFTDVSIENIYEVHDVDILYEVILNLNKQQIDDNILKHFGFKDVPAANLTKWEDLIKSIDNIKETIKLGLIGKYIEMPDAYLSVYEALNHSGYLYDRDIEVILIDAAGDSSTNKELMEKCDGVVIPGGFGKRGMEGILDAITYLKTKNIPVLGIGMGMQLMVVEHFQNNLKLVGATSTELDDNAVIKLFDIVEEKDNRFDSSIRLGAMDVTLVKGSMLESIYQKDIIRERHRNRYEFNNTYMKHFKDSNMKVSALSSRGNYLEAVELTDHPFFIGVLYHPEFLSRPLNAHPLFNNFVEKVIKIK